MNFKIKVLYRLFKGATWLYSIYLFTPWVSPAGSKVQKRVCLRHASGWRERHRRGETRKRERCKQGVRLTVKYNFDKFKVRENNEMNVLAHAHAYIQCVRVFLCNHFKIL